MWDVVEKYNWFPRDFAPFHQCYYTEREFPILRCFTSFFHCIIKRVHSSINHQLYYTRVYDEELLHVCKSKRKYMTKLTYGIASYLRKELYREHKGNEGKTLYTVKSFLFYDETALETDTEWKTFKLDVTLLLFFIFFTKIWSRILMSLVCCE